MNDVMDDIIRKYNDLFIGKHEDYDILKSIGKNNLIEYNSAIKKFMLSIIFSNYNTSYDYISEYKNNKVIFKILRDNFKYFNNEEVNKLFEFNNEINPFFKSVLLTNFDASPLNISKAIYHYDIIEMSEEKNNLTKNLLYNKTFTPTKDQLNILIEDEKELLVEKYIDKINCKYDLEHLVDLYIRSDLDKEHLHNDVLLGILKSSGDKMEIMQIYNLIKSPMKYHFLIRNQNLNITDKKMFLDLFSNDENSIKMLRQNYINDSESILSLLYLPHIISQDQILEELIDNNMVLNVLTDPTLLKDTLNDEKLIPFIDQLINNLDDSEFNTYLDNLSNDNSPYISRKGYFKSVVEFIKNNKSDFNSYSLFNLNQNEISKIIENNIYVNLNYSNMKIITNNYTSEITSEFMKNRFKRLDKIKDYDSFVLFNWENFIKTIHNIKFTLDELKEFLNKINELQDRLLFDKNINPTIEKIQSAVLFTNNTILDDNFFKDIKINNVNLKDKIIKMYNGFNNTNEEHRNRFIKNNFKTKNISISAYKTLEVINKYIVDNEVFDFFDTGAMPDNILNKYILNTNKNNRKAKQNPNAKIEELLQKADDKHFFYAITKHPDLAMKDYIRLINMHDDLELDVVNKHGLNYLVMNIMKNNSDNLEQLDLSSSNINKEDINILCKLLETKLSFLDYFNDEFIDLLEKNTDNSFVLDYIEFKNNPINLIMDF